jgi:molybdate transport system substrate-binding protein
VRFGRLTAVGSVAAACLIAGVAVSTVTTEAMPEAAQASTATLASPVTGSITVSAASSLSDVFPVIAEAFEKRYPGTSVTFNFAGSTTLVSQIQSGAPVDVLATASEPTMWKAVNAGLAGRPWLFAKNTMAIAMPAGNPAGIRSLADLAKPGVLVGVCDVAVPCGAAARDLLARNRVVVTPVTRELDVNNLFAKVMSGDLDAGIVYVTNIEAVGSRVTSVLIPAALNVTTTYPAAVVTGSRNPVAAQAFASYLRTSFSAQGILRAYGFAKPW